MQVVVWTPLIDSATIHLEDSKATLLRIVRSFCLLLRSIEDLVAADQDFSLLVRAQRLHRHSGH